MTVRRLDPITGDITTRGQQFTSGQDEIAQTIRTRLRLFLGEYFRDVTDGTPWFRDILGKGTTLSRREAAIRRRIAQTRGVVQIVSFDTDYDVDTRKFTVSGEVQTIHGRLSLNQTETV